MSLLTLLSNSGAVQTFGGSVTPLTFAQWLAATNGGAGPTRYWPMSETSGSTMSASIGGINGTYQNTGDLELNITDAQSARWVGFGSAATPGHATIATALQSAAFTALLLVQFDLVKAKHIPLTTGGGSTPGQFSFEIVDDGAGGLKPRVWSVNASNQPVVYVGTNPGSIPVGTSCALFYVRRSDGTQEVWCVRADGAVSQIALTLSSGTPPGSWSAHPAGTWYVGAWSSGVDPLDGVARSLALWDVALSVSDINALGSISPKIQNVVWARDFDAGEVTANGTLANIVTTSHVHPATSFTPSIVTQGSLGTWSVNGQLLGYAAGETAGLDTQGQYKITKGGIDSPIRGLTIEVTAGGGGGGGGSPDLPFFGQYYGNALMGHNAANSTMPVSSESGTHWFFRAERTGLIDQIFWHQRTGSGYSAGDGGKYTFEIRAADPNTRLPLLGVTPVCKVDNIAPGNPGGFHHHFTNFTTVGQVVAKQPYCLIYRNTHADPSNNYFSSNVSHHHAFFVDTNPPNYQEPVGANPVNPGSSPTPVAGWTPVRIDGTIDLYPWPCKGKGGNLQYRRLGPEMLAFRYTDGQWVGWGSFGGGSAYIANVSGSSQARERFRVTRANRVVSGVFIRIPRYNATTGNMLVTLESGPASDTAGNGTTIEQVSVPHTAIFDVGGGEDHQQNSTTEVPDYVPFIWVPFSQNRTLVVGTIYNLRLSATGSLNCRMWCSSRVDVQGLGPQGPTVNWDEWEAQRTLPWTAWEDSRGLMISSNSGSSWSFGPALSPILFKCV